MLRRFARGLLRRLGVDERLLGQQADDVDRSRTVSPNPVSQGSPARPTAAAASAVGSRPPWLAGLTAARLDALPDSRFYQPQFMPWLGFGDFPAYVALARPYSLVSDDRLHVLLTLARHAAHLPGAFVECGVYKGGTAMLLAKAIAALQRPRELHLFDSFAGMPSADTMVDLHQGGDYADTSRAAVEARTTAVLAGTPHAVVVHEGWIPDTFAEARIDDIAFAHIDVDIHRSVADCCEYVYPRLVAGGVMVFDDYGFPTCPGARAAVDMFFRDRPERPLVLMTGQAVVHKLPDAR